MNLRKSSVVLTLLLCVFLAGCGDHSPGTQSTEGKPYRVVIGTLVAHPALDSIVEALKDEMTRLGYVEGVDVTYDLKNANGSIQLAAVIAEEASASNPVAMVAITTPMSQAFAKSAKVPLVFSAVTDPVGAGLVDDLAVPKKNVTGVSDAWPYRRQLELLLELAPSVKRVGVLYNPGEAASQYGIKKIRVVAKELDLQLLESPVGASSEVGVVAEALIDRVDALYLSSDATVISGFAAASKVAFRAKKPLLAGDSGTVEQGALAAVSVGYPGVGRETARLLARVLEGETEIPVVVAEGDEIYLNARAAELSGIEIPDALRAKAKQVFDSIK